MLTENQPVIGHAEITAFAENKVNLRREDAKVWRTQVNTLRQKLELHIADHPDFELKKMQLSGSLAKGMALSTLNDIDVAVYVEADEPPDSEAELLDWLTGKLRAAYPQMKPEQIKPNGHCVNISFRGSGLDVDVVPVHYHGEPNDMGYVLSKETGEALHTSIPLHLQFIRKRKDAQPDHFAQVVRLVKWWVGQRKLGDESFRFKSFMVEMIAAHLADSGVDFSDYPKALESFFLYIIRSQLKKRISFSDYYPASQLPAATGTPIEIFDPVNPKNNVAKDYTEADRKALVSAAIAAHEAIAEAQYAPTKGRAVDCWRRLFGPSFES